MIDNMELIQSEAGSGEDGEIVAISFSLPEDMEKGDNNRYLVVMVNTGNLQMLMLS